MEHMPKRDDDQTPADEPESLEAEPVVDGPIEPEADPADPVDAEDNEHEQPAVVSRHVRMGRFLGLGAIVGILVALLLTVGVPEDPDFVPANPDLVFSKLQVFGFLALFLVPAGIGLGGLVGAFVARSVGRRRTAVMLRPEHDPRDDA